VALNPNATIAQSSTSLSSLLGDLSVPGIDSLDISGVTTGDGWTAGTTTLYGESITVVVFTLDGFDNKVVAVLPANATLSSFLPVGSGTILDDVSFDDLAFIYVAPGESGTAIDASSFPDAVSDVLSGYGGTVDLKAGANMFGTVDLSASGALQTILERLGVAQVSVPLTQVFTEDLLSQNPQTMGDQLLDEILSSLDIVVSLPSASIGENQVSFTNSQIAFRWRDNTVIYEATSEISATLGSNTVSMDVKIDTIVSGSGAYVSAPVAAGSNFDLYITGSITQTMTLDLFHSFQLTGMAFNARHDYGKAWEWWIGATSTLHGDAVTVTANSGDELTITTDMTLATLIGEPSTPGLDDVDLTNITVQGSTVEVDTTIRGLDADIFVYRPAGASYSNVGFVVTSDFNFASLIPQASGTMLDDFSFVNIAFVWAPVSGAANNVASLSMPGDLGQVISNSKLNVDIKPGLNIFGSTVVGTASATATNFLGALGLPTTDSFLLNGTLSAQMFKPGARAAEFEADILNALDFHFALPPVSISEGPADLSISNALLVVRGDTTDGNKIDINVAGDIDVTLDGTVIDMAMTLDYEHGASPDLSIYGITTEPITFAFYNSFDVAEAKFTATRTDSKWTTDVSGTAELNGQTVDVNVDISPDGDSAVFQTTSTLAQLVGESNLPGLDDVTLSRVSIAKDSASVGGVIDKINFDITAFRRGPGNKLHIAMNFPYEELKLLHFIPQLSDTGLPDISMGDATFLWVPGGSGETDVAINTLPSPFSGFLATSTGATSVDLVSGVNVFGYLATPPGSSYDNFLSDLGVNAVGMYVKGAMPAAIFQASSASASEEIKQAVLDNLDIHWSLPAPNVPGLGSILTFSDAKLVITGKLNAEGQNVIDAGVSGNATFHADGHTFDLQVDIEDQRISGGTEGTAETNTLTFSAQSNQSWDKPLGIDWITLDDVDLKITKTSDGVASSPSDYSVSLGSTFEIGGSSQDVTSKFIYANDAISDASFSFAGPLALSDIPGISDLPNASEFSITSLTVSSDGIEADTALHGNTLDFYAFQTSDNWNFAVSQKNFELSELVPLLDNTPAGDFKLSEAAVLISDGGITGELSSLPTIAQDALTTIYGSTAATVNIPSGLSIVAAFGSDTTTLAKGMKRMGADSGVLIGTIGGIFGGTPDIALTVEMAIGAKPQHNSKMTTMPDGESISLGVSLTGGLGSFVGELSSTVDVTTTIKGDTLVFGSTVSLQVSEEDVRLEYDMSLKTGNEAGKPLVWHKPYGIPGFELHSVTLALGIDEDGAQHFGFAGDFTLPEQDTINFAVDFDLTPEALEFPSDLAFLGSATYLEMDYLEAVAYQMLASDVPIDLQISSLPVPKIEGIMDTKTNVRGPVSIAFVTPGAQDPNLGITSVGFGVKGSMHWLGQDLGDLSVSIGPRSGIFAWGDLANIDFGEGLFALTDNNFAMRVPMPGLSTFNSPVEINSTAACKSQKGLLFCINANVDVIGIDQSVRVDATSEGMSFSASQSFGPYFDDSLTFALTGIDLTTSDPNLTDADFAMSGTLKAELGDEIEVLMKDSINNIFAGLTTALATGATEIAKARAKVNSLTTQINQQRAIVRAAKQKVENAVATAQDHVNDLNADITHLWYKYHHCSGWGKYICKGRYGIEIGAEKGARDVADGILDAAEALVDHVPIDLSPTVWPLIVARDTANQELYLAQESIKGLSDLARWTTKGLDTVEDYVGNSVNIKHASFNGSLRGILAHDDPVDLAINADLFGYNFADTFAFKIGTLSTDAANDFSQLALLGYYGVDHLFMTVLGDVPDALKSQLRGAIGKQVDSAQAANRRQLTANAVDFAKYGAVAAQLQSTYSSFADSYAYTQMTTVVSPLDRLPPSKTLTNEVIELGNSGYCLTVDYYNQDSNTNVDEGYDACAAVGQSNDGWSSGIAEQTLSTVSIMDGTTNTGYVAISNGPAGQATCLAIDGIWASKEVTYNPGPNAITVYQPVFTPSTNQGTTGANGVPSWMTCATGDDQQQWKILDHGEDFFQIINRATQMCAYLAYPTAAQVQNGETAALKMISCVGADTQVFKLAPETPPSHHLVGTVIKQAYMQELKNQQGSYTACVTIPGQGQGNGGLFGECENKSGATAQMQSQDFANYNLYWNYFEDYLGRRRFEAKQTPAQTLNATNNPGSQTISICLAPPQNDDGGSVFDASTQTCDSTQAPQWFNYTKVIGGFTLTSDGSVGQTVAEGSSLIRNSRFPDPVNILTMPLNPMAGLSWDVLNNNGQMSSTTVNVAYTAAEQTNTAIAARTTHWASVKTALDANRVSMSEGNEHCVGPGRNHK
jgi:hypothetical protein